MLCSLETSESEKAPSLKSDEGKEDSIRLDALVFFVKGSKLRINTIHKALRYSTNLLQFEANMSVLCYGLSSWTSCLHSFSTNFLVAIGDIIGRQWTTGEMAPM